MDSNLISRGLRKRATEAEQKLWQHLRRKQMGGNRFRRQHPIGKRYVVDFICLEKKLVIEVDGGHHADQVQEDLQRETWLKAEGYRVLRFWNYEIIKDLDIVKRVIWEKLDQ